MADNQDWIDRFTLLHLGSGFVLNRLNFNLTQAVSFAIIFELVEPILKRSLPQIFPNTTQDSWTNKVGDVIAVALGWLLSERSGRDGR